MSRRLVDQAGAVLERRTSRRGFLIKSTMAASALTVSPWRYLLRPGSAYAAICGCAGSTCDCGQACCDGYTEFCCVVHGSNSCPPGSFTAGWWKADGTGFCSADRSLPRYYIDCNRCVECGCRCGGSCDNRRTCCTHFRYGQCNQQVGCIGVIDCRVVTCTPPWDLDPTCTTAAATDNFTGTHDAPCLHPPPPPRPQPEPLLLLRAMSEGRFFLSNTKMGGIADVVVGYGDQGDIPIVGDWNGDGIDTPGVVRGDTWYLRNSNTGGTADIVLKYGTPGDIPIVGDWNGDGIDTPGVVRGDTWYLRNSNTGGTADIVLKYGNPGDFPIVGDWNGDGIDTPGVVRGDTWYLRNSNTGGTADIVLKYGNPGDFPIVGDWNGNGVDTPGVIRGDTWYLRNSNTGGTADAALEYGNPGDIPLAGDWNGDRRDSPGIAR